MCRAIDPVSDCTTGVLGSESGSCALASRRRGTGDRQIIDHRFRIFITIWSADWANGIYASSLSSYSCPRAESLWTPNRSFRLGDRMPPKPLFGCDLCSGLPSCGPPFRNPRRAERRMDMGAVTIQRNNSEQHNLGNVLICSVG